MSRRQEKAPEGRGAQDVEARTSRDVEARPSRDYEEQGPTIDRGSYQPPQAAEAAYEGSRPVSYQVCFLLILSLHFLWRLCLTFGSPFNFDFLFPLSILHKKHN